jgi:hypothetical protein
MFADAVDHHMSEPKTYGWNGAIEYTRKGVGDDMTAFFFKLVRGLDIHLLQDYMKEIKNASKTTEDLTRLIVLCFQTRATRGMGKGEKQLFYEMLYNVQELFGNDVLIPLLPLIPFYGYYKDYLAIMSDKRFDKEIKNECLKILANQALVDYKSITLGTGDVSIVGKYLPREKSKHHDIAVDLASFLFEEDGNKYSRLKKYRKLTSTLNEGIQTTTEVLMCSKKYSDIDFKKVSSLCMHRNRKAFANEQLKGPMTMQETGNRFPLDEDRVTARKNLLATKKLKGGQLFPHEIVGSCLRHLSETEVDQLGKQWTDLRENVFGQVTTSKFLKHNNTLPMIDVSGSMTSQTSLPLKVAISLGILLSELCNTEFRNLVLTFDTNPTFVRFTDDQNIHQKVKQLEDAPWGGSTDILKAFKLILGIAEKHKLSEEDIPDLMIVSDMQFNAACGGFYNGAYYHGDSNNMNSFGTQYEVIKTLFIEHGLKVNGRPWNVPKVIFWNVNSDTKGFPVPADTPNTYLLSGFSPSLFKYVMDGEEKMEETPEEIVNKTLDDPAFDKVRQVLSNMKIGQFATYVFVETE